MSLVTNILQSILSSSNSTAVSSKGTQLGVCPDGSFCRSNIIAWRLYIVEERHETVVHMQLLVAVEKRQPWIVSNKVNLGFLVSA